MAALHRFVDKTQLTSEFGGLLSYDHQDWVRFRMVSRGRGQDGEEGVGSGW